MIYIQIYNITLLSYLQAKRAITRWVFIQVPLWHAVHRNDKRFKVDDDCRPPIFCSFDLHFRPGP